MRRSKRCLYMGDAHIDRRPGRADQPARHDIGVRERVAIGDRPYLAVRIPALPATRNNATCRPSQQGGDPRGPRRTSATAQTSTQAQPSPPLLAIGAGGQRRLWRSSTPLPLLRRSGAGPAPLTKMMSGSGSSELTKVRKRRKPLGVVERRPPLAGVAGHMSRHIRLHLGAEGRASRRSPHGADSRFPPSRWSSQGAVRCSRSAVRT